MHNFTLVGLVLLPLLGSLIVFSLPREDTTLAKQIALFFSLATVVYTAIVGFSFKDNGARFRR